MSDRQPPQTRPLRPQADVTVLTRCATGRVAAATSYTESQGDAGPGDTGAFFIPAGTESLQRTCTPPDVTSVTTFLHNHRFFHIKT